MVKQNVPNNAKRNGVKTLSKIKLNTSKRLTALIAMQQIKRKGTIEASGATSFTEGELRRMYPRILPIEQGLASKASIDPIGNW